MNKLILEILPYIEKASNNQTTDHDLRHEIHQHLILKCYEKERDVKRMFKDNELSSWLNVVARNCKLNLLKRERYVELTQEPPQQTDEPLPIDKIKPLQEMISVLNHEEKIWIGVYLDCNLNISELHRRTGISRRHAKKRIDLILEKWKHLDIYLQD